MNRSNFLFPRGDSFLIAHFRLSVLVPILSWRIADFYESNNTKHTRGQGLGLVLFLPIGLDRQQPACLPTGVPSLTCNNTNMKPDPFEQAMG